eukprot:c9862_g1_i1 orf=831-2435(-)
MSLESDLLFAHSDTLLMSDFGNLTEFDDFPKDLFLNNAMEVVADEGLLGELDCKDDLKPLLISEVNDAFGASLKSGDDDDDMDTAKAHCSPFTMFMNEATSEPLGFINMGSKLDSPTVSDGIDIQSIALTRTINSASPPGSSEQGVVPPSHRAMIAASELNCMSLDDLDLSTNALCTLSSPPLSRTPSLLAQGSRMETASSIAPLSPLGKAPMNRTLLRREPLTVCSAAMVTPSVLQINSPVTSPSSTTTFTSPSSTTTFSNSDGGSLFNMMLRSEEGSSIHRLKGPLPQAISVLRGDTVHNTISAPRVMQEQVSHNSSMQRSQSSHALGQLRMSGHIGPCADDFKILPACKQEVPLSSASSVSLFTPYQAPNTQGRSAVAPPMRRVFSTGDLQTINGMPSFYNRNPENAIAEEAAGVKIGHYTMEERKMKLHRYRQKRTERNFTKKIKYACRKTLADSRPRVRGRFARTDEMGDSSFKGSELPLIDEYEEVISHRPRMIPDQQTYLMGNNSCNVSSNSIAPFWSTTMGHVAQG